MFLLARTLGRTIDELDLSMSRAEFEEWQAYYELEPWGTHVEDDRWRIQYMLTHKAHFNQKNVNHSTWLDRDPEETARRNAKAQAAMSLDDRIEATFARFETIDETDESHPSE